MKRLRMSLYKFVSYERDIRMVVDFDSLHVKRSVRPRCIDVMCELELPVVVCSESILQSKFACFILLL